MQFAANQAGWEQGGRSGATSLRSSRIPMPNWGQLLDRPIPETHFGCEYSVVSVLVGCEEEDGATHAVHGRESAVCVPGMLAHFCNSCWEDMIPH